MTQHDTVLERSFVKQKRGYSKQGIEPSSCLVDCLAYEIGRKLLFKNLFIFKRIMQLRKRHTSAVKPTVHNFGSAFHLSAALTFESNFVYIRLMKFYIFFKSAKLSKFLSAADDFNLSAVGTYPDGKRRTPISLSRHAPINDVFKEVTHTSRAYRRRHPIYGSVVFKKLVAHLRHLDKPAGSRIIQKRRVASPTERIAVLKHKLFE